MFQNNLPTLKSQLSMSFPFVLTAINSPIISEKTIISNSWMKFQMIERAKKAEEGN